MTLFVLCYLAGCFTMHSKTDALFVEWTVILVYADT
jgi:hypothetical protein